MNKRRAPKETPELIEATIRETNNISGSFRLTARKAKVAPINPAMLERSRDTAENTAIYTCTRIWSMIRYLLSRSEPMDETETNVFCQVDPLAAVWWGFPAGTQ